MANKQWIFSTPCMRSLYNSLWVATNLVYWVLSVNNHWFVGNLVWGQGFLLLSQGKTRHQTSWIRTFLGHFLEHCSLSRTSAEATDLEAHPFFSKTACFQRMWNHFYWKVPMNLIDWKWYRNKPRYLLNWNLEAFKFCKVSTKQNGSSFLASILI